MKPFLRYAKLVFCLAVVLLLILLLFEKFYTPPPSFYYTLYVSNNSSNAFVLVRLIQLTDVMARSHDVMSSFQVIPRQESRRIQIPGELDAPDALFALVAYPSTGSGVQLDMPLENAYVRLIPFSDFRANTFDSSLTPVNKEKISIDITDGSFRPVGTYVPESERNPEVRLP